MAKKKSLVKSPVNNKKRGRRGSVEVDKVAMTAAALGSFMLASEVSAAEADKQLSNQALPDQDLLQTQLDQSLQLDPAALAVPELPSDLAQLLGGELPTDALPSDLSQISNDVPVTDLDGMTLSQANPDTTTAPGVDAKTTMSDAGSGGSASPASGAGSAAGSAADAGAAAGGAAAGGLPGIAAFSSIPAGVFAGAIGVAAVAGGGGGAAAATGGGGGVANVVTAVAKGLVVDGNVAGAKIFYDANANGVLDADEKWTTTKADGSYELTGYTATSTGQFVVMAGGVDVLTGQTVGMMVTPHGYTNVSPLTTLLAASPGVTEAQLKAKLGIDPSIDLNNYDPLADMKSSDPIKAAAAQKAFTISQQVYAVLQTAASLQAKTSDGTVDPADITSIAGKLLDGIMSSSGGDATAILQDATQSTVAQAASGNTELQASVSAALNTVTSQISSDYANLSTVLKSGDANAIANAVKVAAVSQTALTSAVSNGDTSSLALLSNAESLNKLADSFKDSIATNITNGGTGSVTITPPEILTVAQATTLANGAGLPAHYTIADGVTQIKSYLTGHSDGSPLLTSALGVVVKSATAIPANLAVDILRAVPTASFEQLNVVPGVSTLYASDAILLAQRYMKFAAADQVTVGFNPTTELASVVLNAQALGTLGVDTLLPFGSLTLTAAQATAIVTTGHMVFNSTYADITLNLTAGEVTQALGSALGAQALHAAGIDFLAASSGSLSLTTAQAQNLLGAGLQLSATQHGSVVTDDTSNIPVTALPSLLAAHIDTIGSSLPSHALETSNLFAQQMVTEGLHFAASDEVHLGLAATGAEPTHLSASLKDLQKLGVDSIGVAGHAGNVFVDVGSGNWGTGALPSFKAGDTVDLMFDNSQLDDVIAHKADLVGANVDELHTTDSLGQVSLDITQADALLGGDGTFNVGADLGFNTYNTVTLTVENNAGAITHVAGEATALHQMGVDKIDVAGSQVSVDITDAQAQGLISGGLEFSTDDHINLAAAAGTHLHNSLQDLQKLGVDSISVIGGGAVTLGLGDFSKVDFNHLPTFHSGDQVTLSVSGLTEAQGDLLFQHMDDLHAANIDTLYVSDSNVLMSLDEFSAVHDNGMQFSTQNDVTLEVDSDHHHMNGLPALSDLQQTGIDHLAVANPIMISDDMARSLTHAGLDFTLNSDVTVSVDAVANGTHLSSTLKDLQHLKVDTVMVSGADHLTVDLGPGAWDSSDPLPNFNSALNVTLNLGASQIGQINDARATALHNHGIDTIQVHGTADQLNALSSQAVTAAHVDAFTLDMTEAEFADLASALMHLPQVGSVHVDKIDVSGMAGHTSQLHVSSDVAHAMIDAGLSFEAADHIGLDVQVGAHGTSFATNANTLHQLGVDDVTVHFDNSHPIDLGLLSHFDDSLNVTLDLSETPDANLPPLDADTGALLRSLGFDNIEVNADVSNLSVDLLGNNPATSDGGALDIVQGTWGMQASVDLQGGADIAHAANLDVGLQSLFNDLPGTDALNFANRTDLIDALHGAGITEMTVERGATQVSDGLLDALADSGMLHALPNSYIAVDATASGNHLYTSLKDMADLDVDSVTTNANGNVYINLGDLGQVGALAEVKAILSHLDADMFHGAGTPTLVLDTRAVEGLLDNTGHINSDVMAGLEQIGIKEVAVLVGHNESAVVAQSPLSSNAPAVKIIGQDADPTLFDELHHARQ